MRYAIAAGFAALLLTTGCSGNTVVRYKLTFDTPGAGDQQELTLASIRTIERRLESMGEQLVDKEVTVESGSSLLTITVADRTIADLLTEDLTQPLQFRIMEQAPEAQADTVVIGHGGFRETGIDDRSLYSASASEDAEKKGIIQLAFTDQGRTALAGVFRRNKGAYIGLFVRGRLASKLLVESDTLREHIVIRDLPTSEIARVFADDLNVGIHVTFTRLP
ncbi:MAG: hypothetical protein G01um101425_742 [Candidatus Peregrinibacteria bacterium Gr01-1014_25]|nr:MAG: hypothetical protein G01um101425_742 [Candidatus Peregrinibacteria bacterium Gr01-1014_25]